MKITKQNGPPEDLLYFDEEVNLTPGQVEDVVEIFNTPLTGAYNWDYTIADNRIKKLYELGKELNWNGSIDLNWEYTNTGGDNSKYAQDMKNAPGAKAVPATDGSGKVGYSTTEMSSYYIPKTKQITQARHRIGDKSPSCG